MKKTFYLIFLITINLSVAAQVDPSLMLINGEELTVDEFLEIQIDGWAIGHYQAKDFLINFSNNDYVLHFYLNCEDPEEEPSFLIEYSNNYRDGTYGGLDFVSSESNNFELIVFNVDEEIFENPFTNRERLVYANFLDALKIGKVMSIEFYVKERNLETNRNELELVREMKFSLKNGELLEEKTSCRN